MSQASAGVRNCDAHGPVFLHSMWRTGSSYLLSQFDANLKNMVFYEPFNGEIGSTRLRQAAAKSYGEKQAALNHPVTEGGYFNMFDRTDPQSGKQLWRFARPRLPLFDVYNGLSEEGYALLAACIRVAESENRIAIFGFCHSGEQVGDMKSRFGGRHIYLFRDPHSQFASYNPDKNDFFVAATIVQLLVSKRWSPIALMLVPKLNPYRNLVVTQFIRKSPHWMAMKLARRLWRSLNSSERYALFYLSWMISNSTPRQLCETELSIEDMLSVDSHRQRFEQKYGIKFSGLLPQRSVGNLPENFKDLESQVHELVQPFTSRPEIV